ncbi:hypothetical protein O6H91_03G050500 [Diphasiastrum complanatum]|uniref:Uncharacterized protein n=1 Tax=Diphasiastrum complanatum TaxID=34168 RepID=A0ACC2E647_DIPCM|nr:hypothetical protein O6H91_03G050500 [Diphasiastrum complanatum]
MDLEDSEEQATSDAKDVKRKKKTPQQIETLERVYAEDEHPSEALRMQLSAQLGLTNRQIQMWFCNRRLKKRKGQKDEFCSIFHDEQEDKKLMLPKDPPDFNEYPAAVLASEIEDFTLFGKNGLKTLVQQKGGYLLEGKVGKPTKQDVLQELPIKRLQDGIQEVDPQTAAAFATFTTGESWHGEPYREDGPVLGFEFDSLPPGAFDMQIEPVRHGSLVVLPHGTDGMKRMIPDTKPTNCEKRPKSVLSDFAQKPKKVSNRKCNQKIKSSQCLYDDQKSDHHGDKSHSRVAQASRENLCSPSKLLSPCQEARILHSGNGLEGGLLTSELSFLPSNNSTINSNKSKISFVEQYKKSGCANSIHSCTETGGRNSQNSEEHDNSSDYSYDGSTEKTHVEASEEKKISDESFSVEENVNNEEDNEQYKDYCYNGGGSAEREESTLCPQTSKWESAEIQSSCLHKNAHT